VAVVEGSWCSLEAFQRRICFSGRPSETLSSLAAIVDSRTGNIRPALEPGVAHGVVAYETLNTVLRVRVAAASKTCRCHSRRLLANEQLFAR
jgi:hypothetical protein